MQYYLFIHIFISDCSHNVRNRRACENEHQRDRVPNRVPTPPPSPRDFPASSQSPRYLAARRAAAAADVEPIRLAMEQEGAGPRTVCLDRKTLDALSAPAFRCADARRVAAAYRSPVLLRRAAQRAAASRETTKGASAWVWASFRVAEAAARASLEGRFGRI